MFRSGKCDRGAIGRPLERVAAVADEARARDERGFVGKEERYLLGDLLGFGIAPHRRSDLAHCLRSEEHTSELQSLMRISYAVFCLKKKKETSPPTTHLTTQEKCIHQTHTVISPQ